MEQYRKPSRYSGNPEDLNSVAVDSAKKSVDTFVNPGTPATPLVGVEDRKTGRISGQATARLRENMGPKG